MIRKLVKLKTGGVVDYGHDALNEITRDKANTPTMGGVLIVGAIAVSVLLLADLTNYYVQMGMFCLLWLTILGGVDDWLKLTEGKRLGSRQGLKSYEKLLFQLGLGVLLGMFVFREGTRNYAVLAPLSAEESMREIQAYRVLLVPFYKKGILLSASVFMVITVLVTASTSNAVNLTDGMDGLASGCVGLCGFAFMVLSYFSGQMEIARSLLIPHVPESGELAILCGAMVGACLGFLWFNCHPASVWMGDTGSLPLGGLIGYVAIVIRQELMLFIVGGMFVIELLSVVIQVGYFKATGGKRVFLVAPIHHHFHMKGWTETQVVIRFWMLAAIFAAFSLLTLKLR